VNPTRHAAALGFGLASALAVAAPLRAQPAPPSGGVPFEPLQRPGEIRPELPGPAAPKEPTFVLPALPVPGEGERRLSRGPEIVVREFRVTGSSIFDDAELARVTAPYLGRPIASEELLELRDRLTRLYVDTGHLNSGAVLPDQDVREGVVEYRIVEGRLADVAVEGNRWFRADYLESRILRGAHTPLDVKDLESQLQLLQQDPRIRRVDAELVPGERPGDARLRARFEEEPPYVASLELSNHDSPSIGSYRSELNLAHRNLTGRGDVLRLMAAATEGLNEYELGYEMPVTSFDTTLGGWFYYGSSDVVEEPFDDLDISSRSKTFGLELRQPIHRTLETQFELALTGEWRESENFLLGDPYPFSEGTDDGRAVVSVVRFRQDFLYRDLQQVVALRSQLSLGLDVFGATMGGCEIAEPATDCSTHAADGDEVPDAQFLAWLGQLQWVRRFGPWGLESVFRTDVQLATRPLFSLEQFSVGGHQSVRGYRENELVRDDGLVSSLEIRIPLWSNAEGSSSLQLAPFIDVGRSWNTQRDASSPHWLTSAGVGLRASLTRHLQAELYWGHAFQDVPDPDEHDLQDSGLHFSLVASF
jgi:hemolysin activation/secretion protein